MSTTATVSTMSPPDRARLAEMLAGAVRSCVDQMDAVCDERIRRQVDAVGTHGDTNLEQATRLAAPAPVVPVATGLGGDLGPAITIPAAADLSAGLGGGIDLPASLGTIEGLPEAPDVSVPAASDEVPASAAPSPADVEVRVAWRDEDAVRRAVHHLRLRSRWTRDGGRVRAAAGEEFELRWSADGMATVSLSSPEAARLFERVNRRYVEDALRRHAARRGCRVDALADGGLVVRRDAGGPAPAVQLPPTRPGRLEVDFHGFRGRQCQRVLGALSQATGVRVIDNREHAGPAREEDRVRIGSRRN